MLEKIKEMIPNVEVIPFEIPQLRNKNKKNHEFITFNDEIGMSSFELSFSPSSMNSAHVCV